MLWTFCAAPDPNVLHVVDGVAAMILTSSGVIRVEPTRDLQPLVTYWEPYMRDRNEPD
jgi:hypothetical protein